MTTESLAIVGLTLIGLALPLMGAWFYQVFALKHEVRDVEARVKDTEGRLHTEIAAVEQRLTERINRVEDHLAGIEKTLQQLAHDFCRAQERIEGRLNGRHELLTEMLGKKE